MNEPTQERKRDHLQLCGAENVEFARTTTLLEDVRLVHCALPELAEEDIDLTARLMGRTLAAPLLIAAITGGVPEAARINRDLARAAARAGIGMQLGSQRALAENPDLLKTYAVRDVAPDILLLGNIGLAQARDLDDARLRALVEDVGADGLCLHLNPAMEMIQAEGDRNFRDGLDTVRRLVDLLGDRLVVKETGCGLSRRVGEKLVRAGVRTLDAGGAGGASWVRVEHLRSDSDGPFAEWGIPTAASLLELADLDCTLIASGGLRNGLDAAKAIALGADFCAAALPFLRAQQAGGAEAAAALAERIIGELRAACLLSGSGDLDALRRAERVITGDLLAWKEARVKPRYPDDR